MGAMLSEPINAKVVERAAGESWTAAACTMQGYRRTHEDAHVLVCSSSNGSRFGVFAVLDGHGGDKSARLGADLLQEHLCRLAKRGTLTATEAKTELQKAFIDIDITLREKLPLEDSSGSTVVAAIVTESGSEFIVQLAHAGDSRAVLCLSDGRLLCTDDHKPGREDETRRIQAAGGTVEPGTLGSGPLRVDGALAVSRAIADFRFKPVDMLPERCKVTAVPEVQTVTGCKAGDWLMLACDGVFDVMTNEEVQEFVAARLADKVDGGEITSELLTHCLDKGSKDNCTACLVQFFPPGSGKSSAATRELMQGAWRTAPSDIQSKYAEFFAAEGFERHAAQVREAIEASPPSAAGRGRGSAGGGGGPSDQINFQMLQKLWKETREAAGAASAPSGGGRGTGRGSLPGPPSGPPPGPGSNRPGLGGRGNPGI